MRGVVETMSMESVGQGYNQNVVIVEELITWLMGDVR